MDRRRAILMVVIAVVVGVLAMGVAGMLGRAGAEESVEADKNTRIAQVMEQVRFPLSSEDATAIALAHAGFHEDEVTVGHVSNDIDDGRELCEVEFACHSVEYDYKIDVFTGEIVVHDHDAEWVDALDPDADLAVEELLSFRADGT